MKSRMIQDAICDIDDDLIEAADVKVLPMKKKYMEKIISGLAAACLIAVCVIVVIPQFNQENNAGRENVGGKIPGSDEIDEAGGINGKINIKEKIQVEGTDFEYSNEEGYAYLESVSDGIQNDLKAMGVNADNFRIMKSGYSHLRTGDAGNSIAVNWKDYIACKGDEVIAIITVAKDENGFHHYPAWGSPSFADYGKFLAEHKGEELVYIWAGDVDAILTPDHQIFSFGADLSAAINESEVGQYYTFFKMEQNTYVPE